MKLKHLLAIGSAALVASWVLDKMRRRGASEGHPPSRDRISDPEANGRLTAAIENTFPASDPYEVGNTTAHSADRPIHRRPAVIDPRSIERQAELLDRKRSRLNQ